MIAKLVFENLKHRPLRSLLSMMLIAGPVTMLLSLVGLTHGMSEESQRRQRGVGADIVVRDSTAGSVTTVSGNSLSGKLVPVIETRPHVEIAIGVINHMVEFPVMMTGVDIAQFDKMTGGFTYLEGHGIQDDYDVAIDQLYAEQKKARLGSKIKLLNHEWTVVGIVESGKLARIAAKLTTMQDLEASNGKVGQIYVKVDDPKNIRAVIADLKKFMPNTEVVSMQDFIAQFNTDQIPGVKAFTTVIVVIGVVFGFFVVCLSMYMAVLQRTREFGILKALGAGKPFILATILAEALLMGVGGTIAGIVMSFGAKALIHAFVPATLTMIVVASWWPISGAITLGAAALGSLYPGWSAASHDAIEALSYE